jgi:enoyl-CoA hydratase
VAKVIMSRSQTAVRYAKQAINRGLDLSLEEGLEMESRLFGIVLGAEDAKEGIKAYKERKRANAR